MFYWFGAIIAFVLFVYFLLVIFWKKWIKQCSDILCQYNIPLLGSTPYLAQDSHGLFKQIRDLTIEYNGLWMAWAAWRPIIFVSRKEQVEIILKSQEMIRKALDYDFLHEWLGTGLLTSWGVKWKSRRRAINPSFHISILNDFTSIFIEQSNILIAKVNKIVDTNSFVDVQSIISHATLDVMCDTAMGVKMNAQGEESEYVKSTHKVTELLVQRIRKPWIWPTFIYRLTSAGQQYYKSLNILHNFTTDVINKRIESRQQVTNKLESTQAGRKKAFLDILLDLYDKGEIDVAGIREEVDTFMFEGHDTTAAGLSWIIHELGNNLHVQEKLHREIFISEETEGSLMNKISANKYLECVIKEGLRKHPPISLVARLLEKDETIGVIRLPKGASVFVNLYDVHRCEEYWSEPSQFKPERFLEDDFPKRNPYVYVPFSAGPRNCIGQKFAMLEMKVIVYQLMKHFTVKSLLQEDEVKCSFDIVHKSMDGLFVRFQRHK